MKIYKVFLLASVFSLYVLFVACAKTDAPKPNENLVTATVALPTAKCATCKTTITAAVKGQAGVTEVKVSGESPAITAVISYDKTKTDENSIFQMISKAGYDAGGIKRDEKAYEGLEECCK